MVESSLKTTNFGLKPVILLVFNNSDLKVGATDLVIYEGFSPDDYFFYTFLDRTHLTNEALSFIPSQTAKHPFG